MSEFEEETYSAIFTALKHPIRRKILRLLYERERSFTEMQNLFKVDSPYLTYHLDSLKDLVSKNEMGNYRLSSMGESALELLIGVEETSKVKVQSYILPSKWKACIISLVLVNIVLAGLYIDLNLRYPSVLFTDKTITVSRQERIIFINSSRYISEPPPARQYYTLYYTVKFNKENKGKFFIIKDKTKPGLYGGDDAFVRNDASQYYSKADNVKIEYNRIKGHIKIIIDRPRKGDEYFLEVDGESPWINMFALGKEPRTSCNPAILHQGDEIDLEVTISDFRIQDNTNLNKVVVDTSLTVLAKNSSYLGSEPEADEGFSDGATIWSYMHPNQTDYGAHTSRYHLYVGMEGPVIFRTYVFLYYQTPIFVYSKPIFESGFVVFSDEGSYYRWQYEHVVDEYTIRE